MLINIREFMEIAGFPADQEAQCAVTVGAHFEVFVREKSLADAQADFERVQKAWDWFAEQRDRHNEVREVKNAFASLLGNAPIENDGWWQREERRLRILWWFASVTVQVVEAGDYEFPEYLHLDRKGLGAYYTPISLIIPLLDSALQPVIDEALGVKKANE